MTVKTGMIGVAALALVCAALSSRATAAPTQAPAVTTKPVSKTKTEAERTLDAIRIEGEIDVPQVLFIQARDRRRFRDGTGRSYLANAADIARGTQLPARLCVVKRHELNKEEGP